MYNRGANYSFVAHHTLYRDFKADFWDFKDFRTDFRDSRDFKDF